MEIIALTYLRNFFYSLCTSDLIVRTENMFVRFLCKTWYEKQPNFCANFRPKSHTLFFIRISKSQFLFLTKNLSIFSAQYTCTLQQKKKVVAAEAQHLFRSMYNLIQIICIFFGVPSTISSTIITTTYVSTSATKS